MWILGLSRSSIARWIELAEGRQEGLKSKATDTEGGTEVSSFNFGVTGAAIGILDRVLLRAVGYFQPEEHRGDTLERGGHRHHIA